MPQRNDGIMMKCGRCLQNVPLSEMKYAADGKTLVCLTCRGAAVKERLAPRLPSGAKPAPKTRPPGYDASPGQKATKYACTSCGFTFSRASLKPQRCPYCAKETVILQDAISSAKLLDESE